ncbi:MAG: DNA gyrase inhibitor YacG [Planctomycetes bacterium]|nr:DNA gyrase inhibitor YacG [Planctomycetota bacterium]
MLSNCPICDKPLTKGKTLQEMRLTNAYFPFCSERCKLIDLGAWLDSKYSISAEDSVNK